MSLYSAWPSFAIVLVALLLVDRFQLFTALDAGDTCGRVTTIDGLRGFLALGVFIHHLSITYVWLQTGVWTAPKSNLYQFFGQGTVALFFMITGFLFWGLLIEKNGTPSWGKLYIGRLFRIGPLYLFTIGAMLLIVFARTGLTLTEPVTHVIREIVKWLLLGIPKAQPDVNGLEHTTLIVAGVTWTLHYEWMFYFLLLPISFFAKARFHLPFSTAGLILSIAAHYIFRLNDAVYGELFFVGMVIASMVQLGLLRDLSHPTFSVAGLGIVLVTALGFHTAFAPIQILLIGLFFLLVAGGNTMFGLLLTRSARRLGNISYSIYLTQGLFLTLIFSMSSIRRFATTDPSHFWVVGIVNTPVLIGASILTYLFVERPGIQLGKRIAGRGAAITSNSSTTRRPTSSPS